MADAVALAQAQREAKEVKEAVTVLEAELELLRERALVFKL